MNKKQLVRFIEQQKVPFVSTGTDCEGALAQVVMTAKTGGNAMAAVFHYQNTLLQAIVNEANCVKDDIVDAE